ncbi:MAG: hypothetical protein ACE5HV_13580 [Acidobacteriota bacterium]
MAKKLGVLMQGLEKIFLDREALTEFVDRLWDEPVWSWKERRDRPIIGGGDFALLPRRCEGAER